MANVPLINKKVPRCGYTKSATWADIRKYKGLYLFLLPAFIVTLIFSYIPMTGVIMAFQDFTASKGFFGSPFVGFKHFQAFLESPDFYRSLRNTLAMNGLLIVFGFPLPIMFALLINEVKHATIKKVTQTITYLPHFISWVVIGGILYRMLEQESGNVNLLLDYLGMETIPFMREESYFWAILTSSSIWKELGWNSIIYLATISTIDPEMYEAATMDGAGRFKKLLYITLPGLAPIMGLMFIFTIATIVGGGGGGASFDAIYNMSNPLVINRSETLDYFIYIEGIRSNHLSFAAAVGLALALVSFAIVVISNKLSKKISGYGVF